MSNVISGDFTVMDTSNTTLFSITSSAVNASALTVKGVTVATTAYVNTALTLLGFQRIMKSLRVSREKGTVLLQV